jgi:glutamate 5-kinase
VLSSSDGLPALSRIANLVEQMAALRKNGVEIMFVASGATGVGRQMLNRQVCVILLRGVHAYAARRV